MKVVSLFSGAGGLDLGFKQEGYNILWAIDNNANAVASYKANIGDHIICEDKSKLNRKATIAKCKKWLKAKFLEAYGEWFYGFFGL